MALPTNALLSTVSASALCDFLDVPVYWPDWDLCPIPDAMLDDGTMIEFKTTPTGRLVPMDGFEMHELKRDRHEAAISVYKEFYGGRCRVTQDLDEAIEINRHGNGVGIDYSAIEQRILQYLENSLLALYGTTTNQMSAEPEPLTMEKLKGLFYKPVDHSERLRRYCWSDLSLVYRNSVHGRWLFDLETDT
ncbi:hypothetical protein KEU06_09755 [Pseudaminobacter sp. 19-2017]|uniref:Uncharacterized protein n=1 Tax=Pseudaminobacter soli (ex Zhang et al. 2022) TaxID=2831468 RepID=A0A942I942_9HYPH|nr:hypothetical protein [Pseudaminobacter soli]MBS3648891.1 hypothetical protein [Pseudaminobacter soli]